MIVRKIVIRFCNNIRHFSNEINKRGGGIFLVEGGIFLNRIVDSRLGVEMKQRGVKNIGSLE